MLRRILGIRELKYLYGEYIGLQGGYIGIILGSAGSIWGFGY